MTAEQEKQYKRLIDARNFHYENLNKWLLTFYAIIGALFVALWTLHKEAALHQYMELCIAIVGYVVSVGAILSIKGYYYWETNWIMLVHHFEKVNIENKEDRVYSVFANKSINNSACCPISGANISTSKVALAITWFISQVWGMIVIYFFLDMMKCDCLKEACCQLIVAILASIILTQMLIVIGVNLLASDLSNLDDLKI